MTIAVDRPDASPPAADQVSPPPRWHRIAGWAGVAALAVPFVAIAAVALTRAWVPTADVALMELRVHDVGGAHTPLTGAYSRLGWNHPGPLSFWLLALPYRLAGARPAGMAAGTVALHAAFAIGCLAVARRRGGLALTALVALVLAIVLRGLGAGFLALTWNPDLPVLALAFLVLATWSVVEGDRWLLPVVVGVACFAWQSHVIFVPVTAVLVVVAIAATVVPLGSLGPDHDGADHDGADQADTAARRQGSGWWIGLATAATAAVCLAPLVVEQLTNEPGNLRLILTSLLDPRDPPIGLGRATAIAAAHLSPVGTWISGIDPANPITAGAYGAAPIVLVVPAAASTAAAVAAWRAGARGPARLVALTGLCALTATVAVTRTTGVPFVYLFDWLRPLAALLWASIVWAGLAAIGARDRSLLRPRVAPVAAVAVALATVVLAFAALGSGTGLTLPDETSSRLIGSLAPATVAATTGRSRVALTYGGGWCAGELGHGLAVQLIEHGVEVAVADSARLEYGAARVRGDEPLPTVELVCGQGTADYIARSGLAPVAAVGGLDGAERAELARLQEGFRADLRAAGREGLLPTVENRGLVRLAEDGTIHDDLGEVTLDRARLARFEELMEKGDRAAAVLFRPAPA